MPTLQELDAEIVELQEKLQLAKALADATRAYEQAMGRTIHHRGEVTTRQRSRSTGRASPVMQETEKIAAELMEARGGPVPTADVVKAMEDQGVSIPGDKPINVVSARLSNNPRFKARRGLGYWFNDRPWPDEAAQTKLQVDENEAPSGGAAGASEAGEGHASPNDSRSAEELIG